MTGPKVVKTRASDITNNAGGGVMTDEVGVITGELTLRSELRDDSTVALRVQYKDADEWYTVTGGACAVKRPEDLEVLHPLAVSLLNRPEG